MVTKDFLNKLLTPVSRDELHKLYERIIGARAPAVTEAAKEPVYIKGARSRAESLGISYEKLLDQYSESLMNSNSPTPNCLIPEEVQSYSNGTELSSEQQEHIGTCEPCRNLLDAARPSSEVWAPLVEQVRLLAVRATVGRTLQAPDRTSTAQPSVVAAAKMFK
jgi:hypothetical protein